MCTLAMHEKANVYFPEQSERKLGLSNLELGANGLKVTSEPSPIAGQAYRSVQVTQPSSSHARRYLIRLSRDNRCTR
ncbi:hypothetical protein J6590_011707 [Homalodisca vitripennis]|nr:hypothetical protein J6590_011707 [Homalodisca vitripennis]